MPTQRFNLTNQDWQLVATGNADLQREDSKETVYLHIGTTEPDLNTPDYMRLVDNGIYSYRGTENVYARSLDSQAFLNVTPIAAGDAGGGGADVVVSGTLASRGDAVVVNCEGKNSVTVQRTAGEGTLYFDVSADGGTTWHNLSSIQPNSNGATTGNYLKTVSVACFSHFKVSAGPKNDPIIPHQMSLRASSQLSSAVLNNMQREVQRVNVTDSIGLDLVGDVSNQVDAWRNNHTKFDLVLKIGTAVTPPVLALEMTYLFDDGTSAIVQSTQTLQGVAGQSVMATFEGSPHFVRCILVSAGVDVTDAVVIIACRN